MKRALFIIAPLALVPMIAIAWTGPTGSPPNGNVAAPINTGASGQVKQGDFAALGNIGVGTPTPGSRLDVNGNVIVRATWDSQAVQINGNQIWKSGATPDSTLYLQWSVNGGNVMIGGQSGFTNGLTVQGGITARDRVTSPQYCIGTSCITSWASGSVTGSGTTNYLPRFTAATTLGNSSITSDGTSATANGNFFVTGGEYIQSTAPTIYFQDSNNRSAMLHANNDQFYILSGCGVNSGSWCVNGANWPLQINLVTDAATFGGNVALTEGQLTVSGAIYTSEWFRVNGGGGIYWQNWGGGWYMSDTTWIRAYGSKSVYTPAQMRADGGFCIGTSCITSWTSGIGGSGTTNYIPRFTAGTTLGNSTVSSDGSSSTANGNFFVTNNLNVTANVTAAAFLYSSDQRLKREISPLTDSIEKVSQLSGVTFVWKPGTVRAGESDVGVIAQEVERVLPEAVHTDEDGYKAVDYARLVPLLINAINDQQKEIDALKEQVAALEAR